MLTELLKRNGGVGSRMQEAAFPLLMRHRQRHALMLTLPPERPCDRSGGQVCLEHPAGFGVEQPFEWPRRGSGERPKLGRTGSYADLERSLIAAGMRKAKRTFARLDLMRPSQLGD